MEAEIARLTCDSYIVITMKARLVKIGNSRGVRIPKPLLEQAGLDEEVDITARNDAVVIRSLRKPRAGWAAAFREMAKCGDDALVDEATATHSSWDETQWQCSRSNSRRRSNPAIQKTRANRSQIGSGRE